MDIFLLFPKYKDLIYLIIIASFLGFEIISHVPMILISPMNSAMNSIHGLIVIGGIYVVGKAKEDDVTVLILGFISIILGIMNLVGGSLYTDRMLKVYKSKDKLEE
jgi:NAD(P) transhydrogenase subunit alpha